MAAVPSGRQFEIAYGELRAIVVEVGGGIRGLWAGERPLLDPYDEDAMCDGAHGAILAPWPNRLEDGRYRFEGEDMQLPLTEPEAHSAIHGLVRWQAWRPMTRAPSRVVMGLTLHPSPGYPFTLELRAAYELGPEGLTATLGARNTGGGPCPFALGQHLYLSPGAGGVDAARLEFGAATRIAVDPERHLPTGPEPVASTGHDFSQPRTIGAARLDDAFTDLARDRDGRFRARLEGADGRGVELWQDAAFPYVQVYTGDHLAPGRRRRALAVEPMTAPANAFRSGEGLWRIAPGGRRTARWGVRPAATITDRGKEAKR